jgi:transposase-like protein
MQARNASPVSASVLTGTPRRRRWRDAEKAAIVAESLALGAKTREIALRCKRPVSGVTIGVQASAA